MISPTFQIIRYSSKSEVSFVLTKHLSSQIHIHPTKKDIFCEENLKELLTTTCIGLQVEQIFPVNIQY